MSRPKIGLALGGGGARGIAHIGVMHVLEMNAIPVDYIAGTSIGAIIGAAYALEPQAARLEAKLAAFIESDAYKRSGLERFAMNEPAENFFAQVAKYVRERIVINLAHHRNALVSPNRLQHIVEFLLDDVTIEQAEIPLSVVATNLDDGSDVVFQFGSLRQAVLASASIPGFIPPSNYMGHTLVDGAATSPVPVQAALDMGADIVIAVDVGQDLESVPVDLNIVEVIFRSNTITSNKLRQLEVRKADLVLRPDVGHVHWADFRNLAYLVSAGERAAESRLQDMLRLARPPRSTALREWFARFLPNGRGAVGQLDKDALNGGTRTRV